MKKNTIFLQHTDTDTDMFMFDMFIWSLIQVHRLFPNKWVIPRRGGEGGRGQNIATSPARVANNMAVISSA